MLNPIQIGVPERTQFQLYVALIILIFLAFAILYVIWNSRYAGLPENNRAVKASVLRQIHRKNPNTMRIPSGEETSRFRIGIRSTVEGDPPEHETLRSGSVKLAGEVRESWDPIARRIPKPILRTWTTAVFVATFGAIAVSTSAVTSLITKQATYPSLEETVTDLRFYTLDVYLTARDILFQFPYLEFIWDLTFAYSILIVEWLYNNWPAVATSLFVVGVGLYAFEQSRYERPGRVFSRSTFGFRTVFYVLIVWMAGVIPTVFVRNLGYPKLSAIIGFVFAVTMVVAIIVAGARRWWRSFDRFPRGRYAYLVTRTFALMMITVGWVMVSLYIISSAINGQFLEVVEALRRAPIENKVLIAMIAFSPVARTAYEVRKSWPDLKAGFVETSTRTRIKSKALGQGIPYLGVVFGYIIIFTFTDSILIGTLGAISLGIALRLVYSGLVSVKFGKNPMSYDEPAPSAVLIQSYTLDVNGDEKYYTVVDGDHEYAADDVDSITSELVDRVSEVAKTGNPTPSLYGHHARDLVKYGIVDIDETRHKLVEQTRKSLLSVLRQGGGTVDRDRLRRKLDDLPPDEVREQVTRYVESGIMSRARDHLILERDPWARR